MKRQRKIMVEIKVHEGITDKDLANCVRIAIERSIKDYYFGIAPALYCGLKVRPFTVRPEKKEPWSDPKGGDWYPAGGKGWF